MHLANTQHIFPLSNYGGFMGLFFLGIAVLLALDLGVLHRSTKVIHWKSALKSVIVWTALALAFNVFFWWLCKGWLNADPSVLAGSEFVKKDGSYTVNGVANEIGLAQSFYEFCLSRRELNSSTALNGWLLFLEFSCLSQAASLYGSLAKKITPILHTALATKSCANSCP